MWKNILDGQEERELLGLIKDGDWGRKNAITAKKLTNFFNVRMGMVTGNGNMKISEKRVRELVRVLREKRKVPIGSATDKPAGYYIINDPDDLERNYQSFLHRGLSILTMGASLKNTTLPELLGQLRLKLLYDKYEIEGVGKDGD